MARWSDDLSEVLLGVLLGAAAGYAISVVLRKASSSQAPPSLPPKEPVISLPKPAPEEPEESMISEQLVSEEPEESMTGPSEEPTYAEESVSPPSSRPVLPPPPPVELPPCPPTPPHLPPRYRPPVYCLWAQEGVKPEVIPPTPEQLAAMKGSPTVEGRPPDRTITIPSRVYTIKPEDMITIYEEKGLKYASVCAVGRDANLNVDVRVDFSTTAAQETLHYTWCQSPVPTDFVKISIINYSKETVTVASPDIYLDLWK